MSQQAASETVLEDVETVTCSRCTATAIRTERRCVLPLGWEHPTREGHCRAVSVDGRAPRFCDVTEIVCGECVARIISDVLDAIRTWSAGSAS